MFATFRSNRLHSFGGSIAQWKRVWKVKRGTKSDLAETVEKEMGRARVLIAEQEIKRNGVRERKSNKTWMSEALSREEERIMREMQQATEKFDPLGDWNFDPRRDHRSEAEQGGPDREKEASASS